MTSSGMPWIKLYGDFLDDSKIGELSRSVQLLFVQLLLVAGECDAEGALVEGDEPMTLKRLSWRLRFDVAKDIQALVDAKLVTQEDGVFCICNFAKRQDRPQSDKRALWRARQEVKRKGLRGEVYQLDGGRCCYCGKSLTVDEYVVDHVVPPDRGGNNSIVNLVTCCVSCNTKKAGRLPDEAGMTPALSHREKAVAVTTPSQPGHNVVTAPEESREEESREADEPRSAFSALAKVCRIDLRTITSKQRGQLNQTEKKLREARASPGDISAFGMWWDTCDWRGKKGQPPYPSQVRETWGAFTEWRNKAESSIEWQDGKTST